MDTPTLKLITRAVRAGLTFDTDGNRILVHGTPDPHLRAELRDQRDHIRTLLTGNCAACNQPAWIHEADTHIPWCHPCAQQRGTQLLRHEHPDRFTTQEVA